MKAVEEALRTVWLRRYVGWWQSAVHDKREREARARESLARVRVGRLLSSAPGQAGGGAVGALVGVDAAGAALIHQRIASLLAASSSAKRRRQEAMVSTAATRGSLSARGSGGGPSPAGAPGSGGRGHRRSTGDAFLLPAGSRPLLLPGHLDLGAALGAECAGPLAAALAGWAPGGPGAGGGPSGLGGHGSQGQWQGEGGAPREVLWKVAVNSGALEPGSAGVPAMQLEAAAWLRAKLSCGRTSAYQPPSGAEGGEGGQGGHPVVRVGGMLWVKGTL